MGVLAKRSGRCFSGGLISLRPVLLVFVLTLAMLVVVVVVMITRCTCGSTPDCARDVLNCCLTKFVGVGVFARSVAVSR